MKKNTFLIFFTSLFVVLLFFQHLRAESISKLHRIRIGQHPGFTRLVFDAEGAKPLSIGPVAAKGLTIVYEHLELAADPARILRKKGGAVRHLSLDREDGRAVVTITFKYPDTEVRTFYMKADPPAKDAYRLILDFYPKGSTSARLGTLVPFETAQPEAPVPVPASTAAPSEEKAKPPGKPEVAVEEEVPVTKQKESAEAPPEVPEEAPSAVETFLGNLSGQASLIARPVISGDGNSSKFTEYRDFNSVTGEWSVKYEKEDEYFLKTDAENVGQDDQYYDVSGGWYGKFNAGVSYDEIPHRYAFDAFTLYSGVGSGVLSLPDPLQIELQGETSNLVDQANTLKSAFANAGIGDPEIDRKKLSSYLDFIALDPFSFRVEFGYEEQDGTRPFFGSFFNSPAGVDLGTALEIFEPIDNQTFDIKLIAEYAQTPYFLSVTYYFQDFQNNEDTLRFDNPFRIDDAILGPSEGLIDLAPDNYYHNLSFSGSYMNLPFNSRISANAAWGWMRQDDDLVPFTVNTTLTSPPFAIDYSDPSNLPKDSADAKVNTSLYNVSLNTRPLDYMGLKARFRHYDYDNDTDTIIFPDGYVITDSLPEETLVRNLPSSYRKTKADFDVNFDIWNKTRLNLDFTYDRTSRDNREVDRQEDYIFGGSIDTSPQPWLDLRTSYSRTERDIGNYDFDVYLDSGQDLEELPSLRKYDQADVSRNDLQLLATVYPLDPLTLSTSFTYGKDDFEDSDFGLTDDEHFLFSFDADFALTDRLQIKAFYTYENFQNEQHGQGEFDGGPVIDWKAEGEDEVNTVGGGLKYAIIADRLIFDISYSYSDVDGKIDFSVPDGSVDDFDAVDDTELHILDTRLTYNVFKGFYASLGYYYEKFEYDDYNTEGFTLVPTDQTGAFNGAILADTLPEDYDAHIVYTKFTYTF